MKRRSFVKLTAAGTAYFASAQFLDSCKGQEEKSLKPNILLIITDQQHINTISALGCKHIYTPAMDKLAANGVSFLQSYSPNPVCSPARASIFTGRTPSETGVYTNGQAIRKSIPHLGVWFTDQGGYEAIYSGKWHLPGYTVPEIPGFNTLANGWSGPGATLDSSVALACESWLRNYNGEKPFIMVASFLQPHDICEWLRMNETDKGCRYNAIKDQLPPLPDNFNFDFEESEMYSETRLRREPAKGNWSEEHWRYYFWSYYRNVEMVDAEVARLLRTLDETGFADNTIIVFTSDHGEGMGHHQTVRKSTVYDESAKVPLILTWPGRINEGVVDSVQPVSGYDIMPTLCEAAGIPAPEKQVGLSLLPTAENSKKLDREFIAMEANNNKAQMIRSKNFKYAIFDNGDEYFFDMINDPGETVNLVLNEKYTEQLHHHRMLFKDWIAGLDVDPRVPNENRWDLD